MEMEMEKMSMGKRKRRILDACFNKMMKKKNSCKLIGRRLPEEMIREILLRLSVRDVHRSKCVSKEWLSIITSREFMAAYSSRKRRRDPPSHGIFIATNDDKAQEFVFYYSSLLQQEVEEEEKNQVDKDCVKKVMDEMHPRDFVPRFRVSYSDYQWTTQVVDGLVCLYSSERLTLVNLCTREMVDLPLPPLPPPDAFCATVVDYCWGLSHEVCKINLGPPWPGADKATNCTAVHYHFGFDTLGKVYKVLSISYMCCERCAGPGNLCRCPCFVMPQILTLSGPSSSYKWREVPYPRPSRKKETQSFCVNGFLCWKEKMKKTPKFNRLPPVVASGFDLKYETFWTYFSAEELPDSYDFFLRSKLSQRGGRITLLDCYASKKRLHIYTHTEKITSPQLWDKDTIGHLPPDLSGNSLHDITPIGCLPNGDILLANDRSTDRLSTPAYSYNFENKSFARFVVGKFPPSIASMSAMDVAVCVTYVAETLSPLCGLIGSR